MFYLPLVWAAVVSSALETLPLLVLASIINHIICYCCDLIVYLIPGTWYVTIFFSDFRDSNFFGAARHISKMIALWTGGRSTYRTRRLFFSRKVKA